MTVQGNGEDEIIVQGNGKDALWFRVTQPSIVCGHEREKIVLYDGCDTGQARGTGLQIRVVGITLACTHEGSREEAAKKDQLGMQSKARITNGANWAFGEKGGRAWKCYGMGAIISLEH